MASPLPEKWMRWQVTYREYGVPSATTRLPTRKAAERRAAEIFNRPGVTQIAVILLAVASERL